MKPSANLSKAALYAVLAGAGAATAPGAAAFEASPEARLHLDYAAHDEDRKSLDDGFLVRRASVGLDGRLGKDWSFEIAYDFADDGDFKDVAVRYKGWEPGSIGLGQFKVPFGLEELSSSNHISFLERSLATDAFGLSRRLGVGFDHHRDRHTFAIMGFGGKIGDSDAGSGVGARLTYAPVLSERTVLHLGVAVAQERPRGEFKFNARPESRVADVKLVNTGDLDDASRVDRLGLEAAWRFGPASVQAERMHAVVAREGGNAGFDGWYVAGSWVLTGEARGYRNGRFRGGEPRGRHGAWELTARYSRIDLDDGAVSGGRQHDFTLGLNYYVNRNVRVMANYIRVRSERRGKADNPDILTVRAQFVF